MYKLISISIILLLLTGCKNEIRPEYTTKSFKNISKDAILNASKTVLLLADSRFNIKSNSNEINAKKATPRYKGYGLDLEINNINLVVNTENNISTAKLSIKQKNDYFDKEEKIISNSTHQLFWDRVEYILGLKKQWSSCLKYSKLLNYDGILCDKVYYENNNATKSNIIKDISIKIKLNPKESKINIIKDIKLDDLSNISLPNTIELNESNTTIKEIKLDK